MSLGDVSTALGWLYFAAWSISFYPQIVLNFQRKSVSGLSLEFQLYNITGFLFYSIYTITNYENQRRLGLTQSVSLQDIAFAVHAFATQLVICLQCLAYRKAGHAVNVYHGGVCALFWAGALLHVLLAAFGALAWTTTSNAQFSYSMVEYLGYVKSAISMVKYTPQAWMNWRRRSTIGWSIGNVLLDITGGTLSFAQQFVDAKNQDDWGVFTKNVPKLLLSVESVGFDILFMVQHYLLYRHRYEQPGNGSGSGDETTPALSGNSRSSSDDASPAAATAAAHTRELQEAGAGVPGSPGKFQKLREDSEEP